MSSNAISSNSPSLPKTLPRLTATSLSSIQIPTSTPSPTNQSGTCTENPQLENFHLEATDFVRMCPEWIDKVFFTQKIYLKDFPVVKIEKFADLSEKMKGNSFAWAYGQNTGVCLAIQNPNDDTIVCLKPDGNDDKVWHGSVFLQDGTHAADHFVNLEDKVSKLITMNTQWLSRPKKTTQFPGPTPPTKGRFISLSAAGKFLAVTAIALAAIYLLLTTLGPRWGLRKPVTWNPFKF